MYRQESDFIQGERRAKAIRFKQNIIFFVLLGAVFGIVASFYLDIVTGLACFFGVSLIALVLKKDKAFIVLLVLAFCFCRASLYSPTKAEARNLKTFGLTAKADTREDGGFFKEQVKATRAIPSNVLGERGGYVSGVMFGDKSGLEKDTIKTFRGAGISHILAVSGLHAGIIMGALCFLLRRVKRRFRLPILYFALFAMIVLSGFSPSVLRAGLMMGIFLIADTFGFRYNLINSLFLAATIILFILPYNLFNAGFLMSFTATLGIGLFYPHLYKRLEKWGKYIGGSVAMYIACQAVLLPISLLFFNELSIYGVLGNIFAVPIVAFALISGMVGMLLYPVGLAYYPLSLSAAFMEIIEYIAGSIEALPFSSVKMGGIPVFIIAVYYGLICVLCNFAFKNKKYIHGSLAVLAVLMLVAGFLAV